MFTNSNSRDGRSIWHQIVIIQYVQLCTFKCKVTISLSTAQVQRRTKKTTDQEAEAAFLKEAGNRRHKEGAYEEAIELYSRALGYVGWSALAKLSVCRAELAWFGF